MLKKILFISMLVFLSTKAAMAQQEVTGTVRDAQGPMPGANVAIKGSNTGSMSDMEGNYSITVENESAILVFSFIGYDSKEIEVDGRAQINVTLQSSGILTRSSCNCSRYKEVSKGPWVRYSTG